MSNLLKIGIIGAVLLLAGGTYLYLQPAEVDIQKETLRIANAAASSTNSTSTPQAATAILAGGCFWCTEADFEKMPGVLDVVSGYAPVSDKDPGATGVTYKNYAGLNYREVVEVTYDPERATFANLVEWLIKHSDPTDAEGSFYDRGVEYSPAVYYEIDAEKKAAEDVIRKIDEMRVYAKPIAIALVPRTSFHPAEEYHQDYYKKNTIRYSYYRNASGRDAFIKKHWGTNTGISVTEKPQERASVFKKPSDAELRLKLTSMQYRVTQENGTEPAFDNEYWNNHEEGIYVDIVSDEPLFSSLDKFDSGTGWPSFTKPLEPNNIVLKEDRSFLLLRTEVRSKLADSHLGHVFNDAPPELGGIRYCMNSAALRFVPKDKLVAEGYGKYAPLFK